MALFSIGGGGLGGGNTYPVEQDRIIYGMLK